MAAYDLLAVGTPVIDVFAKVDDEFLAAKKLVKNSTNFLPREKLDALELELGKRVFLRYPGDNARNVCETLARLGGSAAYGGRIAGDSEGSMFESSLSKYGVQSAIEKKGRRTGKILCLITGEAERTFAADLSDSEEFAMDKLFGYEGTKFVYATTITLLSRSKIGTAAHKLFIRARARRMKTILALESPKMIHDNKAAVKELMREADIVFMNEEEREALGVSHSFLSHLGSTIFLKNGAHGSMVYEHGKTPVHISAVNVKKSVDTTGAGDAYAAGVIYGLSSGMSCEEAAKIGSKTGAATVTLFGSSLPHDFKL